MKPSVLIVEDEKSIRSTLGFFLSGEGYSVSLACNYDEALEEISRKKFDLIFADILLGGKTGIDLLKTVKDKKLNCPVVMITGYPDVTTASEAVRFGAFDYIVKPVEKQTILHTARIALEYKAITDENERHKKNLEAIFRSVEEGIITVDNKFHILALNERARKICDLPKDSGRKSFKSVKCCGRSECLDALKNTIKEKKSAKLYRLECNLACRPHQIVTVNTTPLVGSENEFYGALMVIKDETSVVNLEREIEGRYKFHNIISKDSKMQKIYSLIGKLSSVPTTVLITGESGTGKELVAEALHYKGDRKDKPLVKVNCSALSENLIESELFGHVKGSFTGALKDKAGRFKMADRGTIFLDEIGDISPKVQLRLLRVLQEREFEPVGEGKPVKVDVRVIAATNQNLLEKVDKGEFREDLYYRLKVVEIFLPPLRERRNDIPLLAEHFIEKFNKKLNKNIKSLSRDVLEIFMNYRWPGNIRELLHTVEHSFILSSRSVITVKDLPPELKERAGIQNNGDGEAGLIRNALFKTNWKKGEAADLLGMDRKTLYRKMKKYNVSK